MKACDVKDNLSLFALLLVYAAYFYLSIFARVDSIEFMSIDPASIVQSLRDLMSPPYYNMNDSYHSKYYGWTYFALNFFVVSGAKLFGLTSEYGINILIRSVLFVIGALLVIYAYLVSRVFFKPAIAIVTVLIFITNPVSSHYFTEIHPETLGLLFQLVGIKFILSAWRSGEDDFHQFYMAVLFLTLSALCKQSFFIVTFLIFCAYFLLYYLSKEKGKDFIFSKKFLQLVIRSMGIFLIVFFVIHPYAFIQVGKFVDAQIGISGEHSAGNFEDTLIQWLSLIINNQLILFNFIILMMLPLIWRKLSIAYVLSVIFCCFAAAIFIYNVRLFITVNYLYPIYALLVFNVVYFLFYFVVPIFALKIQRLAIPFLLFIIVVMIFPNMVYSFHGAHSRYLLDGLDNKTNIWNYINTLEKNTKIAYSPNVAVPQPYKENGCHAWQGCGDAEFLKEYDPDLMIFSEEYRYFNKDLFKQYTKEKDYKFVREFLMDNSIKLKFCEYPIKQVVLNNLNTYLDFLDFSYRADKILGCFKSYFNMVETSRKGEVVVGDSYVVYKKYR